MSKKHPVPAVRPSRREIRPVEPAPVDIVPAPFGGWFSFRTSYTEITAHGDRTHVTSRQTSLTDGKLVTQSFDGELERGAYDRIVDHAQRRMTEQAQSWLRAWTWFLPGPKS